jgi:beta-xylosidase
MTRSGSVLALLAAAAMVPSSATAADGDGETGRFGDQGDGTYRNPVLAADYSDPDVCRVGGDFYMVASTFESAPGVTVLHSVDLVNWRAVGAAIPDLSALGPALNWDRMRGYGEGVYAPSIRFHAGKFWVFVNCHGGEGFFVSTATDPAGPWAVTQVKDRDGRPLRTKGWTDPCPFWDDDGTAYLACSHPGARWFSYLFRMVPDGSQLLDAEVGPMNGSAGPYAYPAGGTVLSPFQSSEGNKVYKRGGFYYLQHIEFLDKGEGQGTYLFRSRHLYGTKPDGTPGGPNDLGTYDVRKIVPVDHGRQRLPGQGGLIDAPDGRWFWLAQFNRYGSDGRTPVLLPVRWVDDWPVIGIDPVVGGAGQMAWQLPKPIPGRPPALPLGDDDFASATLGPQWQWNHQPRADHWSLTERPGRLRLHAWPPLKPGQFFTAGNTLCQRFARSERTVATVKLDLSGMADGQVAGLAHFNGGKTYATVGVVQTGGARRLRYVEGGAVIDGPTVPAGAAEIWLRSTVGFDDVNAYGYSLDGTAFTNFGGAYHLTTGHSRGDFVGVFTFNDAADGGYVDIESFRYGMENR